MCEPVTLGLAIASAVGSVAGVAGQAAQGRAQRRALLMQRQAQAEELQAQAEERLGARIRAARRERARARVAAAESGVSGQSFELMLKDSLMQQDMDVALTRKNLRIQDRASQARFASGVAQTAAPGALDFITAGAGGFSSGLQIGGAIRNARNSRN